MATRTSLMDFQIPRIVHEEIRYLRVTELNGRLWETVRSPGATVLGEEHPPVATSGVAIGQCLNGVLIVDGGGLARSAPAVTACRRIEPGADL